jgi:hypothetical protein
MTLIMMRSRSNPPTSATSASTSTCGSGECRSARQIIVEEERLARNRRAVDAHLRRIGAELGAPGGSGSARSLVRGAAAAGSGSSALSLNKQGTAYLPFHGRFLLVIEIPEDQPDAVVLYAMVCRLPPSEPSFANVLAAAMRLNYLHSGTNGATLGWEGEEVNLCRSLRIPGLTQPELHGALRLFMAAAASAHEVLESAKRR